MPENLIRAGLHRAVDGIEVPQDLWPNIQKKQGSRRIRRLYIRRVGLSAAVLLLAITIPLSTITSAFANVEKSWFLKNEVGTFTLKFVQNIGEKVAEITPALFLPTTLSHAKQVANIPIKLPTYLPEGVAVNDDTPTLVGRFGSAETVAIRVTQKFLTQDGTGRVSTAESELLDIRETSASDVTMVYPDQGYTVEKVKIGEYDGLMVFQNVSEPSELPRETIRKSDGQRIVEMVPNEIKSPIPLFVNWSDGKYWFRVFCGGADRDTLIKIAESMR
ncbi:hypothetical protein [Desulfosporosinus nitroreducens]|uniref:DUF4367 domain-containing protein n=1 Tax=Desulfosporosinus nitroreducens TaxID=2018668 RepID=A0ABT8QYC4_9FIRM|nr:hypothetical protein [Desulfosporosinus nitroreducens]MDO0825554.1 hypothetical protein [Desulfosporosinus nitroreducens]